MNEPTIESLQAALASAERELAEAKRDLDDAEERLVPLIELVERHTLESEESFETEDVLEGHYKERADLRTELAAQREAHEAEKRALLHANDFLIGERDDLRTRLTAAEAEVTERRKDAHAHAREMREYRLAVKYLAKECDPVRNGFSDVFPEIWSAAYAAMRHDAATAPTTATKGEGV
jgi:chromosome segregation ATPase